MDKSPAKHPEWISLKVWNYLILWTGICSVLFVFGALSVYIYTIATGRANLPANLQAGLFSLVGIILSTLILSIQQWQNKQIARQVGANVINQMQNGVGTGIAQKTAEIVKSDAADVIAAKIAEVVKTEDRTGVFTREGDLDISKVDQRGTDDAIRDTTTDNN